MAKISAERNGKMEVGPRRSERLRKTEPQSKRLQHKVAQIKEKSERLALLELDFVLEKERQDDASESEEEPEKPRRRGERASSRQAKKRRSRRFTFRELAELVSAEGTPNFFSCEVGPSMWPKRLRCHCLKWARYKCPRCLGPFCSLECQKAHKEVLCK
ncbi:unnamed protein product [Cladocopium goreaui]|uniref:SWR1 complex subunit 6 (Protein SERRATED LEAVES AND EARLY FLOWERING) n=1 Tax=Cladocopium goreaui TaxID=2562237 RepID=A0A9P1G7A7_9DINO|nr:unnamed protein product [Cladocopium goreaui]